ncbi:MAG: hypothetical protein D3907_01565 [Candidatus Electrothrix sp. AUS3]|nr:hypothetical protein [Candidatus Electrothrix gigas]
MIMLKTRKFLIKMKWMYFGLLLPLFIFSCSMSQNKKLESPSVSSKHISSSEQKEYLKSLVALFNKKNQFICTGVLINESTILTAAHCQFLQNKVLFLPYLPILKIKKSRLRFHSCILCYRKRKTLQ